MQNVIRGALVTALCALAIGIAGGANAQTTTSSKVRNFEVISVDGNYLVFSDQFGTHDISVPPDFRFNVDGRSVAVGELKPGMKGTATVTKTTTVRDVYVTEVKKGTVLSQTGRSIVVKEDTGKIHRFAQSDVDERGIQLFMGDKPVRIFNLDAGDQISAKIVTAGPPEVLTQQQVDAILAKPDAPVAAAPAPAEEPPAQAPHRPPSPPPSQPPSPPPSRWSKKPPRNRHRSRYPNRSRRSPISGSGSCCCSSWRSWPGWLRAATRRRNRETDSLALTAADPGLIAVPGSAAFVSSRLHGLGREAPAVSRSSSVCSAGSSLRPRADPIRLSSS